MPSTNHHFARYADRRQAFDETGGQLVGNDAALMIADWIATQISK
jgi:hypothetical protein